MKTLNEFSKLSSKSEAFNDNFKMIFYYSLLSRLMKNFFKKYGNFKNKFI